MNAVDGQGAVPELTARARAVAPFHVMRILERARALEAEGREVVHFEVGEPDFPCALPILAAARDALAAGRTRYTPAAGLPELRRALADYYAERYGVTPDPAQILVAPGASGALQLVFSALLKPGDRVILGDPSYPCYRQILGLMGVETVPVKLGPESDYCLDATAAETAWSPGVRALVVASPANPTGAVMSRERLRALYDWCRAHEVALIVDEIYQGLVYEASDHSAIELGVPGLYVINSFSKFFGMTGWRLGWLVAPAPAVAVMDRLAQNLFLAPNTLAQYAALAALTPEVIAVAEARREVFRERRDRLLSALHGLGFQVPVRPEGAFYLYAELPPGVACTAMDFALDLLEGHGVALTPGDDFGTHRAQRHVRLAYAGELEVLLKGVQRIGDYLDAAR